MIRKLLIANRGEIACRVIRTAQRMGIRTVAVVSDADMGALHAHLADQTVHIGPSEAAQSYLKADAILAAVREAGADAVHPGYGFLSERADFAELCANNGIVFVGPPASAMRKLGAKIDAKKLAVANDVPVVPGYFEPGATLDDLEAAAHQIGYPVMLKASAGGGGRGMRVVRDPASLRKDAELAASEALAGFGDAAMMVEKLIERPRHIEVQVIADKQGHVACLFERECSLQRRHQKLVEEATSPGLARHEGLWPRMRDAVQRLIRAAGYYGAGTVEFMLDDATGEFYFLEVNARLQVEHPVTEAITGLDLVQLQLEVAAGHRLQLDHDLMHGEREAICGHAIEARIVAEDPARNFMPSMGRILAWHEPKQPGIRIDTGFGPGAEISRYYDSLIAKVIAHGATRDDAIARLRAALLDFHILGVQTNIGYLIDVLEHPGFRAGDIDTGFLDREFAGWQPPAPPPELGAILGSADLVLAAPTSQGPAGVWGAGDGFRNAR